MAVIRHIADIAAHHQWRRSKAPKCEMRLIFDIAAGIFLADVALAVHTAHEHIQVVEAACAGHGKAGMHLSGENGFDRFEDIENIAGRAVHMRADALHPLPAIIRAPVAGREQNIAAGRAKRIAHGEISKLAVAGIREIAEIVFQKVHAPRSKGLSVLELIAVARRIAGTGL